MSRLTGTVCDSSDVQRCRNKHRNAFCFVAEGPQASDLIQSLLTQIDTDVGGWSERDFSG